MDKKLKVWWLFALDHYYPSGALGDLISTYETEDEAKIAMDVLKTTQPDYDEVWIVDVSEFLGIE